MKKVIKFFLFFLLLGCVFTGLTSCGKDNSKKQEPQYEIFLLATESGFTGTYEEWLDSIRGVDGKTVELQVVNGKICWRYANTTSWIELITIEELVGSNGVTPHIGQNGNWFIGAEDTGVKAEGSNGMNGLNPHIGENGNWFIGSIDTGIKAEGVDGVNGVTPHIGENGNWFIGLTDTGISAGFKDKYTITFEPNGGVLPDGMSSTLENISHGQVITSLPVPTREGYNFIGWYTGMTVNDGQFYNYMPVCCNLNLVARWKINLIEITIEVADYGRIDVIVPQGTRALDLEDLDEFQQFYLLEIMDAEKGRLIEPDFILESGMNLIVTQPVQRNEFIMRKIDDLESKLMTALIDLPQEIFSTLAQDLQQEFYGNEMNHVELLELVSQKENWISGITQEEVLKEYLEVLYKNCANVLADKYINDVEQLYKETLSNILAAPNVEEKTQILYQYKVVLSEKAYSNFDATKVIKQRYMYYFKQGIYGLIGENMYDMAKMDLIIDEMLLQLENATNYEDVFNLGTKALFSIKELPMLSDIEDTVLRQMIQDYIAMLDNKEFYLQELEEFKSRLLAATDKKELCSLHLDVIDFIFQKGWRLIYAFGEHGIEGVYQRMASTATDSSAVQLEEVYTKYKTLVMSIEFIDILEGSDLIALKFFQDFNDELNSVYIEDEVKMLENTRAEATDFLNREAEYFTHQYDMFSKEIYNLKLEIEGEISSALTVDDLRTIIDDITNRFYMLIEKLKQ